MNHHDRDGGRAIQARLFEPAKRFDFVESVENNSALAHPPTDFESAGVERRGEIDVQLEQVRTFLGADANHIAKTAICDEQCRNAAPFEQRIGRNRGPQFHQAVGQRLTPCDGAGSFQELTDRLTGCDVARQHFGGVKHAFGIETDAVGEGSAPIDPKFPAA